MKKFRGLKKSKNSKTDDPEKVAEQKLAFFSDEPFIVNNQNSQRWMPQSEGKIPQSLQKERIKSSKDPEISKSNFRRKFLLMKEETTQNMDLKKYFKIYCNEQNMQSFKVYPQKKLLSLTSYMLFDKRKQNPSNQQLILSMHEAKKIELARLKKLLIPKHQRKISFSEEKVISKVKSNPNYHTKHKLKNYSQSQTRKTPSQQGPNSDKKSESTQSLLQVSRVFSSFIRRKQVPNLSVERYHESYSAAKKRLQDLKYVESSLKSNKVKLHQHFEKFAF